jgi:hypothetical protein
MIRTLSPYEIETAAHIGVRRQAMAMARGRKDFVERADRRGFEMHIVGAMAEMIVAREFNLYWDAVVGRVDACDVGGIIEVRCRTPDSGCDLPMRAHDKFAMPHVLVLATPPTFDIVGWLPGIVAWDKGILNEKTGLRFCPASLLWPLDELKDYVQAELRYL